MNVAVALQGRLYVSTLEAAAHLGITQAAVRARLRSGRLRGRRIGGRWRVYASELRTPRGGE